MGGSNVLDFSAYSTSVGITLTGSGTFGYSGTTSGVPNPTGGFAEITQIDEPSFTNTLTLANGIPATVTINSSVAIDLFNLTVAISGAPNLVFTNISTVNGGSGATNTLISGEGTNNIWTLISANGGSYNDGQLLIFTNFADLVGGIGNDSFVLAAGGSATNIDGGAGVNTLTGNNAGDAFHITGVNAGNITGLVTSFTNIQNFTGGTGNDTFTLASGVPTFNGSITGGGGVDTLAATDGTNAWAITGANAGSLNVSTVFSGITNLNGGSGTDTLTGVAAGSNWNITGANAVSVSGMNGTSMEALVGGAGNDTFTLASGVPTFNGSITGGGGVDALAATDGTNAWAITGANAGSLNVSTVFSGITNLNGGSGNDTFTLSGTGHISGLISGGGGIDTLVGNNLINSWLINGANTGTLTDTHGSNAFTGIANLTGSTNNDTFTLASGVLTFNGSITGGGGVDTLSGHRRQ